MILNRKPSMAGVAIALAIVLFVLVAAMPLGIGAKTIQQVTDDTFISANFGEPANTLDPALAYDTRSAEILAQIYETLVLADGETGEFIPQLATQWEVSAAADQYTFQVRPGVTFQNGNSLQPHDVAYSIQRGLLQSDPNSPQWMFLGPIMGYWDITQEIGSGAWIGDPVGLVANANPDELRTVCETVKERVIADDTAGTVTFNLIASDGAFMNVLATYGMILDQEWTAAQGDWDGSCDTWQNYYAPTYGPNQGSLLDKVANGSGPFKLEDWQEGIQLTLSRFDGYWRVTPLWPGGPAGPAALKKLIFKVVDDGEQRKDLLLDGQVDRAYISGDLSEIENAILLEQHDDQLVLHNEAGVLNAFTGIPAPSATDGFFNFNINTAEGNSYIGSGQLDGNGIPPTFFDDIHVRKAFAYAFDYEAYKEQAYGGKAVQRTGPIRAGLMGYDPNQQKYTYNVALANQEMDQAWGGQVANMGFKIILGYNEGNLVRELAAMSIKQGIEALSPKYKVDVVSLPWSDYLSASREGKLPISFEGWAEDYAHPINWIDPYLLGTYAARSSMPENLRTMYQQMADECLSKVGSAARSCYEAIQVDTHNRALQLYLMQPTNTQYVRAEVRDYDQALRYHEWVAYLYAVSKGPLPSVNSALPGTASTIDVQSGGSNIEIAVADTSVSEPTSIVVEAPSDVRGKQTTGFLLSDATFTLIAFDAGGDELPQDFWNSPPEISVSGVGMKLAAVGAQTPLLLHWKDFTWADGACGDYKRGNNSFTVPICTTGLFSVGQKTELNFMPIISGN